MPKKKRTQPKSSLASLGLVTRLFSQDVPGANFFSFVRAVGNRSPDSGVLLQRHWQSVVDSQEFIRHPRVGTARCGGRRGASAIVGTPATDP